MEDSPLLVGEPTRLTLSTCTVDVESMAILVGAKAAEQHGVGYELVDPRGIARRLLEVTGLTMALTVVDGNDSTSRERRYSFESSIRRRALTVNSSPE